MSLESVIDTFITHRNLQVKRTPHGTTTDGIYTPGPPAYFRINASIRPDSGSTLVNDPDSERDTETRVLYTHDAELWAETRDTLTATGHDPDLVLLEPVVAAVDLDTAAVNADAVIEATIDGADGNAITLELVSGVVGAGGELDETAYPAIVYTFLDGVTTELQMETAIAASTKIRVRTPGTPGNVLAAVDDEVTVALAGGESETWRVRETKRYRAHWKCWIERLDRP